jgi:integrase
MLYGLLFLTGMRHGEAVGRRWRDLDDSALPLGALSVATQYRDEPLKTKTPRVVPVHPVLAELLTAWKCSGFKQFFLLEPRPEDFIVPSRTWKCRMSGTSHKGLQDDCKAIGIPGRRVHDTRHTFISLARRDGARKDVLERITHNSTGDIVDRYTTFDWAPLCEAVSSLRLQLSAISQSDSGSSCGSSTR